MAVYKVPQDVEADDKLIGPFSFRQFIYLLIVAGAIALAWGLSRIFIPLAVIPLPFILFFGALALPLRKDQPMEVYLAAVVSFYIKPRKRIWQPDGITSLVEVTAPKTVEVQRTKGFDENEAERRLSYLAGIVDSQGWAVRGVADQSANTAMNSDIFFAAQQTEDVLDDDNTLSKNFDHMISQADKNRRKQMIEKMHETFTPGPQFNDQHFDRPAETTAPEEPNPFLQSGTANLDTSNMHYNPYPDNIHQMVIQPLSEQRAQQQQQSQLPAITEPAATPQPPASPQQYQIPTQPVQQQYYQPPAPQATPAPQVPVEQYVQEQVSQPTVTAVPTPIYQRQEPQIATSQAQSPTFAPSLPDASFQPAVNPPPTTSPEELSPDTIDLAMYHHDLSVETISREANRLRQKKEQEQAAGEEEVVISLR